jgi:hypothetical protein
MAQYKVTVHLSNDFRRTCMFMEGDGFEKAAADGVYGGHGFLFMVDYSPKLISYADAIGGDHIGAANIAFEILNSYVGELHCEQKYEEVVNCYRNGKRRSLSVGDLLMIEKVGLDHNDGRYGVASCGFQRF